MANEYEIKKQICDIGKRMYTNGYVAANDGNISVSLGNGRYLCTPTGVSKGYLTPEMICVIDDKGNQLGGGCDGKYKRTSEIKLHLEIFHEVPGIMAVCHAHPPHATAFAVAHVDVPMNVLPEVEILIGQVPIAPYDTPGSKDFAETILPHLKNKANTILLANHGAVACDKTLEHAYFHLETLDMYCKILLLSKQVGGVQQISDQKVKELLQIKQRLGINDPRFGPGGEILSATLPSGDDFLRGFSARPIAQHQSDATGHGRGSGIAGLASQCGQPQPMPAAACVAGRRLNLGDSSAVARQRAAEDEIERVVQMITDQILKSGN